MRVATSGESATSLCRVIAPIAIEAPLASTRMPFSSGMWLRSTRSLGAASRSFIVASSVCPPARKRASGLSSMIPTAFRTDVGS